jgi:hypothetical protein
MGPFPHIDQADVDYILSWFDYVIEGANLAFDINGRLYVDLRHRNELQDFQYIHTELVHQLRDLRQIFAEGDYPLRRPGLHAGHRPLPRDQIHNLLRL